MQELVHEHTQGLHFGEWVIGPPLQLRIKLSEVLVLMDQSQAGVVEHSAQTRSALMRHGSFGTLLLAGIVGSGLDAGQFDPLGRRMVAVGITDFGQKEGHRNRV